MMGFRRLRLLAPVNYVPAFLFLWGPSDIVCQQTMGTLKRKCKQYLAAEATPLLRELHE